MRYLYGLRVSPHYLLVNYKGENSIYTVEKMEQNKDHPLRHAQRLSLIP